MTTPAPSTPIVKFTPDQLDRFRTFASATMRRKLRAHLAEQKTPKPKATPTQNA